MDECDIADERIQKATDSGIAAIQKKVAAFDVGSPGECDRCGEDRPRLVGGFCCLCRDKFKLP